MKRFFVKASIGLRLGAQFSKESDLCVTRNSIRYRYRPTLTLSIYLTNLLASPRYFQS